MKKILKITLKILLALVGLVVAATLTLGAAVLVSSVRVKKAFGRAQLEHIAALEAAYGAPDYAPAGEETMTGFDAQAAAENGARFNELRFIATHNSYKAYNPFADTLMRRVIGPLGFAYDEEGREWAYGFEPLSDQLDHGIRSFELDVMREKKGLRCAHIPLVDYASNCPDFRLALREIALWSDAHPGHLPITVLVESKGTVLSGGMLLHNFSLDDVLFLEDMAAGALGERLYTPADMLGAYADFIEMRTEGEYPLLADMLGKILVIYHYSGPVSEAYAAADPSLRTQKMFSTMAQWYDGDEDDFWPATDLNQSYACFGIDNWSESPALEVNAREHNMLVRTRCDTFPWRDDAWEAQALATGAFILTTDWPPRGDLGDDPHVVTFPGGATAAYR